MAVKNLLCIFITKAGENKKDHKIIKMILIFKNYKTKIK